jgi:GDP-4-dehydro-6-deoxy-D-mannose reductase
MSRFFITGAQGFVGRYLAAHLLASRPDIEVLGIGRSPELRHTFSHSVSWAGRRVPAPLPTELARAACDHGYRYASIDLAARASVTRALRACRPCVVIHLAAALRDAPPAELTQANVEATRALMEAIADAGNAVGRVIICSTGGIYAASEASPLPFDETAACHPLNPYSASKLAAERLSRELALRHGIDTMWARLFNVVGAGEDDRHAGPEFARQAAEIRLGLRPAVLDVGELETTRDFVDVRDVAIALATVADHGSAGETYNVATGVETSTRSLLQRVLEGAGLDGRVEIRQHPARGAGPSRHVADIRRLRILGFRPRFDLAQSACDMVAYYVTQVAAAAEGARAPVDTAEDRQDRAGAEGPVRASPAQGSAE